MDKHFAVLLRSLTDLKEFLPNLMLVGGWVPYIYQQYLWKDVIIKPHHTTDIDYGLNMAGHSKVKGTIYNKLASLHYPERHLQMNKLTPVQFLVQARDNDIPTPIEFICDIDVSASAVQKIVGDQLVINSLPDFKMLFTEQLDVNVEGIKISIPSESIFVFHKLATLVHRENLSKVAKDLYYIYYILRFSPNVKKIKDSFVGYKKTEVWLPVKKVLTNYFATINSKGVEMVEKEFGPDSILTDMKRHIFKVFDDLK